ncbi:PP2C family protein-serine/threonine phosphatase [Sphingobium phenoxybenzoativorans]|uniref:PP2C family protein-serine/threonine phosphatase n=1 Tax=Sphingobium phenoxybenzoativorans TaxID=1592790 RepID=UPI0009F33F34|nr:protein phosphatase 2C domain-containing protein [Sphingobium phenoxybenzoativorans]
MKFDQASFSGLGPRTANQDRILPPIIAGNGAMVAAIADGVGGASGGGEAAEIAIRCSAEFSGDSADFQKLFSDIVAELQRVSSHQPQLSKMATTLSLVTIQNFKVEIGHVGDTRIYHIRGPGLKNLTQDQTEVEELRRRGILSDYQARRYHRRNVLTSALSPKGEYEIYQFTTNILPGDRLLFLTDGVYEKVLRGGVLNLSLENETIGKFVEALETVVIGSHPQDNFSALGIEIR